VSIIVVANQGGSAGKTASAVTLAALRAQAGYRVRVLDIDAQGNASHWFGHPDAESPTIREVLLDGAKIDDLELPVEGLPTLTLVPAARDTMEGVETELGNTMGGELAIRRALRSASPVDDTIIDCPGSLGLLTIAALIAADVAITVFSPTEKEGAAVIRFEQTVRKVAAAYDLDVRLAAVLPCIIPATGALYAQVTAQLRETYGELITPPVRRTVRIPESYSAQQAPPLYVPTEPVVEDYRAVLAQLEACGVFK
jgi:chromosome partitioning protein